MVKLKTNPVGIDWHVQQLQTKMHDLLVGPKYFNLADTDTYKAYGRCDRYKSDDGYVARVFDAGIDYIPVYWDDSLTAISFFGLNGTIKNLVTNSADMHFVMFANLDKLSLKNRTGSIITHRADEELRQMVANVIGNHAFSFTVTGIDLWIENVLREYPGSLRDDRLKNVDKYPVHCFRINLNLLYNPNKIC